MAINCTPPSGKWFITPNTTNYTGMVEYANCVTDNIFGASIPFMIFIISFITTGHVLPMNRSLLVSSFIAMIHSFLLRIVGWTPDYVVILFAVMFSVSGFIYYWEVKRGIP